MSDALLDTSTFLWFIAGNTRLSVDARKFIENFDNRLFLSVASLWEISIKVSIGKLELSKAFDCNQRPKSLPKSPDKTLPLCGRYGSLVNKICRGIA